MTRRRPLLSRAVWHPIATLAMATTVCPHCLAVPGEACLTPAGRTSVLPHTARIDRLCRLVRKETPAWPASKS